MQANISLSFDKLFIKKIGNYSNRPTIVFLHDSFGCVELWRDFPQKLSELTQCNVLSYDRQGYGKSAPFSDKKRDNQYMEKEADILNELLTSEKIDQAILFGHSDGGTIALLTAAKYPQKIKGIITEGAHIFVEEITIAGIKAAIQLYQTTDLKTKLQKYHGEKTEALFWAWADTWTSEAYRTWNIEHFLPFIQCPAFIIQGKEDEYGTLAQVSRIVQQIGKDASSLIIPKIKHTPHKEVPESILKQSSAFIQQILSSEKTLQTSF